MGDVNGRAFPNPEQIDVFLFIFLCLAQKIYLRLKVLFGIRCNYAEPQRVLIVKYGVGERHDHFFYDEIQLQLLVQLYVEAQPRFLLESFIFPIDQQIVALRPGRYVI